MDTDDPQYPEVRRVKLSRVKIPSSEDIHYVRVSSPNPPQCTEDIETKPTGTEPLPPDSTPNIEVFAHQDLGHSRQHQDGLTAHLVSPASASEIEVLASSLLPVVFPRTLPDVLDSEPHVVFHDVATDPSGLRVLFIPQWVLPLEGWRGRIERAELRVDVDGQPLDLTNPNVLLDAQGQPILGASRSLKNGFFYRVTPLRYRDDLLLKFSYKSAGWTRREFRYWTTENRLEPVTIYAFKLALTAQKIPSRRAS